MLMAHDRERPRPVFAKKQALAVKIATARMKSIFAVRVIAFYGLTIVLIGLQARCKRAAIDTAFVLLVLFYD